MSGADATSFGRGVAAAEGERTGPGPKHTSKQAGRRARARVCVRVRMCLRVLCVCVCTLANSMHMCSPRCIPNAKQRDSRVMFRVQKLRQIRRSPKRELTVLWKSLFFWLFEPKPKSWLRTPGVERKPIAQNNTRCAMQLRFTLSARTGPGFNRILVDAPCRPACRHSMQVVNRSGDESEWS